MVVSGLPALGETIEFDPYLFWVLKPGLRDVPVSGSGNRSAVNFRFSTNDLGLRSRPVRRKHGRVRILVLGDSCTFGLGVDDTQTWPAQLQALLENESAGTGVDVINAGVFGYTSFQGLRFLVSRGLDLAPDVVIVAFWFNETLPWSMTSDKHKAKQFVWMKWRYRLDRLLRRSRLYTDLIEMRGAQDRPEASEEAALPFEKGYRRITSEDFEDNLKAIYRLCTSKDIPVLFLIWPLSTQTGPAARLSEYQAIVARVGEQLGVPVLNLVPHFAQSRGDLFLDNMHATPIGCRVAAEAVAEEIKRLIPESFKN